MTPRVTESRNITCTLLISTEFQLEHLKYKLVYILLLKLDIFLISVIFRLQAQDSSDYSSRQKATTK